MEEQISLPQNNPAPVPVQKHRHLKLLLILLILTFASIFSLLAYRSVYLKKQSATSEILYPPVTPSITETNEWKMYVHSKQGYSIQYPPGWYVYPDTSVGRYEEFQGTTFSSFEWRELLDSSLGRPPSVPIGESFFDIIVSGTDKTSDVTLEEYVQRANVYADRIVRPTELYISEIAGRSVFETESDSGLGHVIYFDKNNMVYSIFIPSNNTAVHEKTINQILSTIRFLE